MLVYAGIDEAGYGPLLGPLCVGCSVFIVNDADPAAGAPNLWRLLDGAVCRSRRDAKNRIAIEDSKKLKGSNASATSHPLKHLERGVLAMLSASHGAAARLPASDDELFSMLNAADQDDASPWCDVRCELPVAQVADELAIASGRIQRAMERAGVSCSMIRCEAIDAAAFNAQVARTNNKATVNFGAAMRLVEIIRRRWPREHPLQVTPTLIASICDDRGMIGQLTQFVINTVLRQQTIWLERGLDLSIGINLSAKTANDPGFAAQVAQSCETWGLSPTRLLF
ncbi:MAG TPA: hypothetical protein PK400_08425, partial [Phycisphaerales bacterium]|nr:hypothetical protein [Phycisphaerales bacterium]